MKKTIAFLMAAVTATTLAAFSIGFTLAYFTDGATATGATASAGYLDASVKIEMANYGVPSDTLYAAYGSDTDPAKSTVTVTNNGATAMKYTLVLTVDADTAKLLTATNGLVLKDADGIAVTGSTTTDAQTGAVAYTYTIFNALANNGADIYDLELTFKGVTLVDGNDYQNKPIGISAEVLATNEGSGGL